MERKTIGKAIRIKGVGLHRGREVELRLAPAEGGIVFIKDGITIPATLEHVVDTRLNTMLGKNGITISTVEHLMSALAGLGITDCAITVTGDEMPAMDGSSLPFLEQLRLSGSEILGEVAPFTVTETLRVSASDAWIEASPGPFAIVYSIDFPDAAIGRQSLEFDGADYAGLIAPARTFGRLSDVEMMRSMGLALGGGLHNAVVVDGDTVLNPEGLRFADEFIRHKVLDCLGDLWLLGRPVTAGIRAYKANHGLHVALARRIREQANPGGAP